MFVFAFLFYCRCILGITVVGSSFISHKFYVCPYADLLNLCSSPTASFD